MVEPVLTSPREATSLESATARPASWYAQRGVLLAVAWIALTLVLIVSGRAVVQSSVIDEFDRDVTAAVVEHRSALLEAVMKVATWLGSWVAVVGGFVVLIVLAVRSRIPPVVVTLAVVAWAGEEAGVTLAKVIVERTRPPESIWLVTAHGWSWPSGHTAAATLVFMILAAVGMSFAATTALRVLSWAMAALAVILVSVSRVVLGVHWTTDVVAGFAFVACWLVVLGALFAPVLRWKRLPLAERGAVP